MPALSESDDRSVGGGRFLAAPAFPDDDGVADPVLRELLAAAADATESPVRVLRSLRDARLLTSVVAVLDTIGEGGEEKDSHMAVVSMLNAAGERGLLAFTGVDALTGWNPDARPVPALGRDIARAALDDGATAVVIDVSGPRMVAVTGRLLHVLADDLDLAAVTDRIDGLLAPLAGPGSSAEVVDVRSAAGIAVLRALDLPDDEVSEVDVVVLLTGLDGPAAAALLDADDDLYALVPGGLAIVPLD